MKSFTMSIASAGLLLVLLPAIVLSAPAEGSKDDRKDFRLVTPSLDTRRNFDPKAFLLARAISSAEGGGDSVQKIGPLRVESIWSILVEILRLLGITDEQVLLFFEAVIDGVEKILAKLRPDDLKFVEFAAGDILSMLQSGNYDSERLQTDVQIIYTIMWPYVDPDIKPILETIGKIISWLWHHLHPYGDANIPSVFPASDLKKFIPY